MSRVSNSVILIGFLAVVLVMIGSSVIVLLETNISAVAGLPMLAVGAVIVLVILLCLLAIVFATYDLQDKTQALALPEGSIRAVIALMLIVLFAILSIYLYGSLSNGQMTILNNIDEPTRAGLLKQYGDLNFQAYPAADGNGFTAVLTKGASQEGVDFAKQLLVLVGTLVTSIASFYFGSRAVAPSTEVSNIKPSAPTIENIDQLAYVKGSGPKDITLKGTNLERISSVKLRLNGKDAPATIAEKSTSRLVIKIDIPASDTSGIWQIILVDSKLGEQSMPQGITVT